MVVSLCGCHVLGDGLVGALVARSFEVLVVEGGEVDAVGLGVISRSSTAQTSVRQLVSPGKRPITLERR